MFIYSRAGELGGAYSVEMLWDLEEKIFVGFQQDVNPASQDKLIVALSSNPAESLYLLFSIWSPTGEPISLLEATVLLREEALEFRQLQPVEYRHRLGVGYESSCFANRDFSKKFLVESNE